MPNAAEIVLARKMKNLCIAITDFINQHEDRNNTILFTVRNTLYECRDNLGEPI